MYEASWGQWTPVCCFLLQDLGTEEPRVTSIKTDCCVVDQASASRPSGLEQDGCLATADRSQESAYCDSCLIKKSLLR